MQQCSLVRAKDCFSCAYAGCKEGCQPGVERFLLCFRSRGSAVPSDRRPPWRDRCLSANFWLLYTMGPNGSKFGSIRYLIFIWRYMKIGLAGGHYSLLASEIISSKSQAESCRVWSLEAATASALPTPGGGPHAAIASVHGTALLEMCFYAGCCSVMFCLDLESGDLWFTMLKSSEFIIVYHSHEMLGRMFMPGKLQVWYGPHARLAHFESTGWCHSCRFTAKSARPWCGQYATHPPKCSTKSFCLRLARREWTPPPLKPVYLLAWSVCIWPVWRASASVPFFHCAARQQSKIDPMCTRWCKRLLRIFSSSVRNNQWGLSQELHLHGWSNIL